MWRQLEPGTGWGRRYEQDRQGRLQCTCEGCRIPEQENRHATPEREQAQQRKELQPQREENTSI